MSAIITWVGADQSGWNLSTGYEGVAIVGSVLGMGDPDFQSYVTERIGPGDRYRGSRLRSRTLAFTVAVGKSGEVGQAWRDLDAAWWRSVSEEAVGLLSVVTEDLSNRYIPARLAESTGTAYAHDPGVDGLATYVITLTADDPYWRGDDLVETWTYNLSAQNFYGGSGGGGLGPPYYLSPSGGFGEAMVSNPGDVPAWPRWKVTGPLSSATLTVDGHTIAVPSPLAANTSIYIHTEPPDVFGDFLENKWDVMTGAVDFAPVPVGATVPVTAQVTSPGEGAQVTMTITPRYKRAW